MEGYLDRESREKALAYRELVEATNAWTDLTLDQVRVLVHRLYRMMEQQRLGPTVVATGNDRFFGMASMFSILSEIRRGPTVGTFRGFDEALNWLLRAAPAR